MAKKDPKKAIGSTQDVLQFAEIHEGIIITKSGELRAILMVTSINFALKSEQEQNAIIFAYQNFLNSLSFPIQILMQSKRLDLSNYLGKLTEVANRQKNELLRSQTIDYITFIEDMIKVANIMDKKFYVVISFTPPQKIQPTGGFFKKTQDQGPKFSLQEFNNYKKEIAQRAQVIQGGLSSIGLRSAALNSQQVVELLYGIYNPQESVKQKLTDYQALSGEMVESEVENMNI